MTDQAKNWDKKKKQDAHGPYCSPEKYNLSLKKSEEDLDFVNVFYNRLTLELGKGLNPYHPRMISAKVGWN